MRRGQGVPLALGLAVVGVAASATGLGCHRADSVLLVEVAGNLMLHPATLNVGVSAGGRDRMFTIVGPAEQPITLPASFSLELDRAIDGPVTVAVDALDGSGNDLGSGQTVQEHINAGGETIIPVTLGEPPSSVPDGGDTGDAGQDQDASAGSIPSVVGDAG